MLQDAPADKAVPGLIMGVGREAGVVVLLDVLLQGQKSDFVSWGETVIHYFDIVPNT